MDSSEIQAITKDDASFCSLTSRYEEPEKGLQNIIIGIIVLGAFRDFRITLRFDNELKRTFSFIVFLGFLSHCLCHNLEF